jgi:hypothetical protein
MHQATNFADPVVIASILKHFNSIHASQPIELEGDASQVNPFFRERPADG